MQAHSRILVTGGTGYVGGRLIPLLERQGLSIRCLARHPEFLRSRLREQTEVLKADLLEIESLRVALQDIETAYYLVHSMGTGKDFEDEDRLAARNFATVARECGVRRIIYLGGLGDERQTLSKHLRSRQEVGYLLRESRAQVIEFRASIVIGSGSLSFELIRALVQKLPVMLCPKWVSTPAQPIAIEDLLNYLLGALDLPYGQSDVFEIGGHDQVSYGEIMQEYARQRGLKRWMISVPFLSPRLSSLWLGLVTPVYARIGRKLVESLKNPTLVTNSHALETFSIRPRGIAEAVARALVNEDRELAATHWSDALSSSGKPKRWGGVRFGTRLVDSRERELTVPADAAFIPIRRIGGTTGWYYGNWLWRVRGWLDLLCGGVGLRRGRRDVDELRVGDAVDCWRVETLEPQRRLRLSAEMKLPGRAWLEFEVQPTATGSRIRQTAEFDPVGLTGLIYWYSIAVLHEFVFRGMLAGIAESSIAMHCANQSSNHELVPDSPQNGTQMQQAMGLIGSITLCFGAAGLGAAATSSSVSDWYRTIAKPTWTPPDWIFGPVWSALYLMMAIAAWLVWRRTSWKTSCSALVWFGLQLALNVLWSVIFFGLQHPGWALAEVLVLWLAIAATIKAFWNLSHVAAILLLPYWLWSSFASVLNLTIWRMNS